MKLIVGLGNPGRAYSSTRHNIGYRTVKELAKEHGIRLKKDRRRSSIAGTGRIRGKEVAVLLPLTFMNLSGQAVSSAISGEVGDLERLMVVCDDINLELGQIRLRKKGSSGGHKGLESIIENIGAEGFPRLRMGIATGQHRGDITHYVLSPFRKGDRRIVSGMVRRAKDALALWAEEGIDAAMNKFNA